MMQESWRSLGLCQGAKHTLVQESYRLQVRVLPNASQPSGPATMRVSQKKKAATSLSPSKSPIRLSPEACPDQNIREFWET